MDNNFLFLTLQIGMGIFWILAYVFIIIRGFKDKTYGMPMTAICANISWEFIFSFIFKINTIQTIINIIWFILDMCILLQFLAFGKNDFRKKISYKKFFLTFLITLIFCFSVIISMSIEFHDFQGKYAAFSQNLLMSILFIFLFIRRGNLKGQSINIAICKMIGSLLPAIGLFFYDRSLLITILSIQTLFFDLLYVILIFKKVKKNKVNYWLSI